MKQCMLYTAKGNCIPISGFGWRFATCTCNVSMTMHDTYFYVHHSDVSLSLCAHDAHVAHHNIGRDGTDAGITQYIFKASKLTNMIIFGLMSLLQN